MSTTLALEQPTVAGKLYARLGEYFDMTKPRLSSLVLVTVAVGGFVASWGQPDLPVLLHAVCATGLIAASAAIANQWLERDTDALMQRTASRPVPTGRVGWTEVVLLTTSTLLIGLADLAVMVNWKAAALGALTWILYVLVYTPLKKITRWNTLVGALPGALPVLIGWAATGSSFDLRAAAMFLIVFLWQFPHFMAIAWKYRDEYGNAGLKMVTVTDPSGRRAGIQAVFGSMALLPVSLVPAVMAPPCPAFAIVAFLLGIMMLLLSAAFLIDRNDATARRLLRGSLIYLPCVMLGLAAIPLIS